MSSLKFEGAVEVRESAAELPLLMMAGLGSMTLVAALAYSLLDPNDSGHETTGSIIFAGKLIIWSLSAFGVALVALLIKPRPYDGQAIADVDGVELIRGGKRRKIAARSLRSVRAILDGDHAYVELERRLSVVRLRPAGIEEAERLAGVLVGREELPVATVRVRRRASYPLFISTVSSWVMVYTSLCALPLLLWLGAILTIITTGIAGWITARAFPTQILVSREAITFLHPLRTSQVPLEQVAGARVVDDNAVAIIDRQGGAAVIDHLADHPLDRAVTAAYPPSQRLAEGIQALAGAGEGNQAA